MDKSNGVRVPAPIFNRRRPRQALFADPNSANVETGGEEPSFAVCDRNGPSSAMFGTHSVNSDGHGYNPTPQNNQRSTAFMPPPTGHTSSRSPYSRTSNQFQPTARPVATMERPAKLFKPDSVAPRQGTVYPRGCAPAAPASSRVQTYNGSGPNKQGSMNLSSAYGSQVTNRNAEVPSYGSGPVNKSVYGATASQRDIPTSNRSSNYPTSNYPALKQHTPNINNRATQQNYGATPERQTHGISMKSQGVPSPTPYANEPWGQAALPQTALVKKSQSVEVQVKASHVMATATASERSNDNASRDTSLRFVTATIQGMKHWSQFTNKMPIMFEVYAMLNSAVTTSPKNDHVRFLVKDDKESINCVFYQIDRQLPRMIRTQWHRCVGTYDKNSNSLRCVSVRVADPTELKLYKQLVNACDRTMRETVARLTEL